MNVSRSVLLEQDNNKVNINGINAEVVVMEVIDFLMDDFEKNYKIYKDSNGLYDCPKLNTSIISYLANQKERILKIVDKEDMRKVLGMREIELFK